MSAASGFVLFDFARCCARLFGFACFCPRRSRLQNFQYFRHVKKEERRSLFGGENALQERFFFLASNRLRGIADFAAAWPT